MTNAATVNTMDEALRQCGVTDETLTPVERDRLDRLGYLVWPGMIDRPWLERLQEAFDVALAAGQRTGHFCTLDANDPIYDALYVHPRVLAAARQVLGGPFRAMYPIGGRAPTPGSGQQALHADWLRAPPEPFQLVTVFWLLDDFEPDNGATRVVPGSHRMPKPLSKAMAQPEARHPDQKVIAAAAGSVVLFNGHLLHGGTRNTSGRPRRVLHGKYLARDLVIPGYERGAIPERFPPAARFLLGEDAA